MLTVISDRNKGVSSGGSLTLPNGATIPAVSFYDPDMIAANDYYPFGMLSRTMGTPDKYRYGFNGQENDNEIKGRGNVTTAPHWEYDARIGRRWNLDPRPTVGLSPYATFNNNPILFSDPLGDTSVVGAGGTHNIEIDEKSNTLQFYDASKVYQTIDSKIKVPVKAGQLRSFTNSLGTFSARWVTLTDGVAGFEGYQNDKGQTYEEAYNEIISSWKYKFLSWGQSMYESHERDPLGHNFKVTSTMFLMGASSLAMEAMSLNSSRIATTTLDDMSALGTLSTANRAVTNGTRALAPYWPANGGALGQWTNEIAKTGDIMDRYGSVYGVYASPVGTPFNMRALSPTTNMADYFQFQVLKPFPMKSSVIAPAFGKIGLGKQYQMPMGINHLEQYGFIKIIK